HERGHPAVRHGDLLGKERGAVGGVAAAPSAPVVADQALGAIQDRLLQHQAAEVVGAAGDELDRALVAWGTPDVVEPGFEGEAAQVLHCPLSMPRGAAETLRSPERNPWNTRFVVRASAWSADAKSRPVATMAGWLL